VTADSRYRWAAPGDINAFFGLMLDNVAGLILTVGLLSTADFPTEFAISSLIPGTAIGVMAGDLMFFALAFLLARRSSRSDVTAMPLGIDTPSIFGITLFVLIPAFREASVTMEPLAAARHTWHIGICAIVFSGVFKLICAPLSGWVRRIVPRAGLLGSLAAIALVIISFLPLLDIFAHPLPGFFALAIVLTSLVGRAPLPFRMPGTLAALLVSGTIFYLMQAAGMPGYEAHAASTVEWFPAGWYDAFTLEWLAAASDAVSYLPIALPFALATVVGGIDCTESAAAAGDEYRTGTVIGIEAVATLVAGFCGGVIQTTPYIGHPAYKAMGGRAAYVLGTALLIGSAGVFGYFGVLNDWIPKPAVFPILIFVGLEITAQSFHATPRRHYAAVALACVPALAFLADNFPGQVLEDPNVATAVGELERGELQQNLNTLAVLKAGFIVTSLLWAWTLAEIIDGRLRRAAAVLLTTATLTLFGVIHSPLPDNRLFLPVGPASWGEVVLPDDVRAVTFEYAGGYAAAALLLFLWGGYLRWAGVPIAPPEHAPALESSSSSSGDSHE
jgi:AGZA family xanthine/uracil permease-like MFS transporter